MLGTEDPNNQKLQNALKELAALVGWDYSSVSYDPANPATLNAAINTALTQDADYVAEAGIPPTPQMLTKVEDAGAKWVLTSVHPVDVKPPVIVNANAYANDEQMGKVLADWFVADSEGKGNAVIEHVPAYPILGGFIDGFQAEVEELCPDCQVKVQNITIPDLTAGKVPEHHGVGAALEPGRDVPRVRRRPVRGRCRLRARRRGPGATRSRSSARPPTRRPSRP